MDKNRKHLIVVTHYEDPEQFWIKKVDFNEKLDVIESKIRLYAFNYNRTRHSISLWKPKVKENVAAIIVSWNKWIRGQVLTIYNKVDKLKIWSIDYGVELDISIGCVTPLDQSLAEEYVPSVFMARVRNYDSANTQIINLNNQTSKLNKWPADEIKKVLKTSTSLYLTLESQNGEHYLGDITSPDMPSQFLKVEILIKEFAENIDSHAVDLEVENFYAELIENLDIQTQSADTILAESPFSDLNKNHESEDTDEEDLNDDNFVSKFTSKEQKMMLIDEIYNSSPTGGLPNPEHLTLTASSILVDTKTEVQPIKNVEDANFNQQICIELKKWPKLYPMQLYAWPHLMNRNSLVLVDSSNDLPTLVYLPAICSFLQKYSTAKIQAKGPEVIIVCLDVNRCSEIRRRCVFFLNELNIEGKIFICNDWPEFGKNGIKFYRCNLFLTTLDMFFSLSDYIQRTCNFRHLIFDSMSRDYLEKFYNDMFIKLLGKNISDVQFIITTREWTPLLNLVCDKTNKSLLLIGTHFEAAVYANTQINVKCSNMNDKLSHTLYLIEEAKWDDEMIVIICAKDSEVDYLATQLRSRNIPYKMCYDGSTTLINSKYCHPETNCFDVLLCSDCVLPKLRLTNVCNLVHYSLPSNFEEFSMRFSLSMDHFPKLLVAESQSIEQHKQKRTTICSILVDHNDSTEVYLAFDYLHNIEIFAEFSKLKNIFLNYLYNASKHAKKSPLCIDFLKYESYKHVLNCDKRHNLMKHIGYNYERMFCAWVQIKIIHILSPVHYSVRLISFRKCLSEDWKPIFNPFDTIDLYLLGLVPISKDNTWHSSLAEYMRRWFSHSKYANSNDYIQARILMDLNDVLLATEINIVKPPSKSTTAILKSVLKTITDNRFGFYDHSMIPSILKMAKNEGFIPNTWNIDQAVSQLTKFRTKVS